MMPMQHQVRISRRRLRTKEIRRRAVVGEVDYQLRDYRGLAGNGKRLLASMAQWNRSAVRHLATLKLAYHDEVLWLSIEL